MSILKDFILRFSFKVEGEEKLKNIEKSLEGIKNRLEFLAATEVAKGLFEIAEKFAQFGEQLHAASEAAGLSVENFQKLSFAAKQSAVSQEELSGALARVSRHLYDARKGGAEAQQAFMRAGFSPGQIQSFKTGSDVLLALSDRFKRSKDSIAVAAQAQELMGRGSRNLIGFLKQGSTAIKGMEKDAEDLGIILSHEQVEALVSVEHSFQKLFAVIQAVGAIMATYLAPIFNTAIKLFLDFYKANKAVIEINIKRWAEDLAYALGFIHGLVQGIIEVFLDFAKTHQTLILRVFEFSAALIGLAIAIIAVKKTFGLAVAVFELFSSVIAPVAGFLFDILAAVNPLIWAITGLVIVVHDLWKIFFQGGSIKDTWIGQAIAEVKSFAGKAYDFLGIGGDKPTGQAAAAINNVGSTSALASAPAFGSATGAAGSNNNYSVNSPITVNVHGGADGQSVGEKVREAVQGHLDRVYRETTRSTRGAVAY